MKGFWTFVIILIVTASSMAWAANSNLATTEILGKEYYVYEVKKGETIYGIAKKNSWDLEELLRLNPDAGGTLHKGMRIYYPTGQVTIVTEMPKPVEIDLSKLEPIKHKVKKGETVYSISRQYNVPLDVIYKHNPTTQKGVKVGEIITLPQNGSSQYYYYTVKPGDTLSSIANTYNTSVEDILRDNAGLTANNLKSGETIRISINSNLGKIRTELVSEDHITQISEYKVNKNETWDDISERTGVEVEILKEANSEDQPKENTVVTVPVVETVEIEKTINYQPTTEIGEEEIREIYDSIKGVSNNKEDLIGVRLALILDEPTSKKDIDFTRGIIIALSQLESSPYKVDLKVFDGRVATNNLTEELDYFEPNLIVSTADKAFPLFLADYGNTNNVQIINAFDLKNDLYEDNSSMVQILPPSGYFNDRVATHIYRNNRIRKLIAVGEEDENDGIAQELFKLYDGEGERMSLEEFGSYEVDTFEPIIIYSYATRKEEVSDFMKNVENLVENYSDSDFIVVGRSNWIALTDDFGDKFNEYKVTVPSRVWLEQDSEEWNSFVREYEEMFEGGPVRSIPNYAASGYDIAKFFIPLVAKNQGDFNLGIEGENFVALQNDINLSRVNNWGGFINMTGYLIEFSEGGKPEKILVK